MQRHGVALARSVTGQASSGSEAEQVALHESSLDLRGSAVESLLIESTRREQLMADSRQGAARLNSTLINQGAARSAIHGGSATGSYRIAARDELELAARAGEGGALHLNARVEIGRAHV